jgi:hypothetical protein
MKRTVYYVNQSLEAICMRRPIPSVSLTLNALNKNDNARKNLDESRPQTDADYDKRLKLAALLHDQGVNPPRWQEADPAPYEAQRRYQETRQAPDDMFVVEDRLYRRSPAIAATPAQGQDALDVYLGAAPKPISELVPVAEVQLRHPLGNRPEKLPEGNAALDRYRLFASLGLDPDHAHEGDAIPHHLQDGLKHAAIDADGKERPLGIPGVYRNPDDGFFYMAHSGTEERDEFKALRRRLAEEKMARTGSADPIVGNVDDPDINEAVAQFYRQERESQRNPDDRGNEPKAESTEKFDQAADETRARLEELIDAIEQSQKGNALTPRQVRLLDIINWSFSERNLEIDLATVNTDRLRKIVNLQSSAEKEQEEPLSAMENKLAATAATQAAAMGSIAGAAQFGNGAMLPARTLTALATEALVGTAASALALPAAIAGILVALTKPTSSPSELTWEALKIAEGVASRPEFSDTAQNQNKEVDNTQLNASNDNQPDPANDNDPSQRPNVTAARAATVAAWLLGQEGEKSEFTPPEKFEPDSQNMRDFQEDFAHAILQGQLPEIWLNGKRLTPPNPGGMLGGEAARNLDQKLVVEVAKALEQCRGISNPQPAGGGPVKQFRIKDVETKGNLNSVSLDVSFTFKHGAFECMYHLNGVDTDAKGRPDSRERRALVRTQENIEKIHRLSESIGRKFAHEEVLKNAGYAYDWIKKATQNDDIEINKNVADFMKNVFSCSRIVRECWRTQPIKGGRN